MFDLYEYDKNKPDTYGKYINHDDRPEPLLEQARRLCNEAGHHGLITFGSIHDWKQVIKDSEGNDLYFIVRRQA